MNVAKAIAPLRMGTPEESKEMKNGIKQYGFSGYYKNYFSQIPSNVVNGIKSLPSSINQVYSEGTYEEKIETSISLLGIAFSLTKGKSSNVGVFMNGIKFSNKWIAHVSIYNQIRGQAGKLSKHFNVKGFNINDVLQMTPNEAINVIKKHPQAKLIMQKINKALQDEGHY